MRVRYALFLFFVFLIFPSYVHASNFVTSSNATYTVSDEGTTDITYAISLKNTTKEYYASSYAIKIGFNTITDVRAFDPSGPLVPEVEKQNDGYTITVKFGKRAVGQGSVLPFTISLKTPDIVQRQNNVWEINIPGIENQSDFQTFNATVQVPQFLGKPSYIKPVQENDFLTFTKEQLGRSGISIGFGNIQYYTFSLGYHLENKNLFPVATEIALPPTTNYQEIQLDDISPKPLNVISDADGNWLAQYRLKPTELKNITVKGKAKLFLYPKKEPLSDEDLAPYLRDQKYWQVSDPEIKKLAGQLRTPGAIYEYVVKTLRYDFSRVTEGKLRIGALDVLKNPNSAVCLEFTDLFVALSRAAGIPAREVDGFAYTNNAKQRPLSLVKDVLHAWPQYYDKSLQAWISVDPTWGNTTGGTDYFRVLDFDHLAFVIKGKDSQYPVPAGGYKIRGKENEKDVFVSYTDAFELAKPLVSVKPSMSKIALSGLPISGNIAVKNSGSVVFPATQVLVDSSSLSPKHMGIYAPAVPPFGTISIPFSFYKTPILTNRAADITIRVGDQTVTDSINVSLFFVSWQALLIGGGIIAVFTIIITTITKKKRRIPVS